ncbi:hypothetical protein E0485_12605 [Paenibacillus albiflavus]|uniref:Uncharacterized protein n=1 Tax=Paenibacillus albiflavus TaxID=2545760 RepID=A0A4R4EFF0_9BACL|nr:DUF5693 family protein [Paenibacillus albiflavus]TCZ76818.1 hypothetical protein E0485_12605 [Paenibacillus albiflavus]
MKLYKSWNQRIRPILWWLVIIGLVAAMPLAFMREHTETSTNNVELVFNYRSLQEISDTQPKPDQFVNEHLDRMKNVGITSMSVFESTLNELKMARRIDVFTPHEAMLLTQTAIPVNNNFTYILFNNQEAQNKLEPIIRQSFTEDFGVQVSPWAYGDRKGLIIEMAMDDALLRPMDPDPITMQALKDKGFNLVVRMSNKRPFDKHRMDTLLGNLHNNYGVSRIVVDSDAVPGFTGDDDDLLQMADKLRKYDIGLATIEMLKEPQKGFNKLANAINYNVVRLHSFTEKDTEKFMTPMTKGDLEGLIDAAADRFVLAVKDRNIRMIYLNAKVSKSLEKKQVDQPLEAIYKALEGPDGAMERIEQAGFTFGPAEPFQVEKTSFTDVWQKIAPYLLLLGGVALIALMFSYFIPELTLLIYIIGVIGAAGLNVLSDSLYSSGLALAASIAAPTVAMILAIKTANRVNLANKNAGVVFGIWLVVRTSVISIIGAAYLVALLNQTKYFLVLEQFRGVSMLHLMPILLIGIYILLFSDDVTYAKRWENFKGILNYRISVIWIILAALGGVMIWFYLSRTGNEGSASNLERMLRAFLEDFLGARPRNKEFLFAHPVFLLGAYLAFKYKNAIYLMIGGVIGQLSIVDTFAHLHTPLQISGLRVVYGLVFGLIIGLVFIAAWEIITRSWKRWGAPLFRE